MEYHDLGWLTDLPTPKPLPTLWQRIKGWLKVGNDIVQQQLLTELPQQRCVELVALIRFSNEEITFAQCLESLLPTIKYGILAYHYLPHTASVQQREGLACCIKIAQEFCQKHPGFKLVAYEHEVFNFRDDIYFQAELTNRRRGEGIVVDPVQEVELDYVNTFEAFTKFAHDQVLEVGTKILEQNHPKQPFIYAIKFDADHICDPQVVAQQKYFLERSPELVTVLSLPKFNVFYSPTRDRLYFRNLANPGDHYIMLAQAPEFSTVIIRKYHLDGTINQETYPWYAYETVSPRNLYNFPNRVFDPKLNILLNKRKQLTLEYLYTFLPEQGKALSAIQKGKITASYFYNIAFSQELVKLAQSPANYALLERKENNCIPLEKGKRLTPYADLELKQLSPKYTIADIGKKLETLQQKILRRQLKLYKKGIPLEQIPNVCKNKLDINYHITIAWCNSVHFAYQKHVSTTPLNDYTDEELIENNLVPFSAFKNSAFCQEIQIRSPSVNSETLFLNEERLLQIARTFNYSVANKYK